MSTAIQFGEPDAREPQVISLAGANASPDRGVITVLPKATLELQNPEEPLSAVQVGALSIPVSAPEETRITGYLTTIRGKIFKTAGARACVLADVAGNAKVIEYPYAELAELELGAGAGGTKAASGAHKAASGAHGEEGSTPGGSGDEDIEGGDFPLPLETDKALYCEIFSLETRDPKTENPLEFYTLPPYALALTMTVQRRTAQDLVGLVIDSIDIRTVTG